METVKITSGSHIAASNNYFSVIIYVTLQQDLSQLIFPFFLMFFIDVVSRTPHSPRFSPILWRLLHQSGFSFHPWPLNIGVPRLLFWNPVTFWIAYLTSPLKHLRENCNLPQLCPPHDLPFLGQWQSHYSRCSDQKSWGPEALLVHDHASWSLTQEGRDIDQDFLLLRSCLCDSQLFLFSYLTMPLYYST